MDDLAPSRQQENKKRQQEKGKEVVVRVPMADVSAAAGGLLLCNEALFEVSQNLHFTNPFTNIVRYSQKYWFHHLG